MSGNRTRSRIVKVIEAAVVSAVVSFATGIAAGAVVQLDSLRVVKNASTIFFDDFADGMPPPSSPIVFSSGPAVYTHLLGTFAEAGGRLRLDTSTGTITLNATGVASRVTRATLATNTSTDPAFLANGLKTAHTFSVTGVFDLDIPSAGVGYGIRLTDRSPSGTADGVANDVVELELRTTQSGITNIRFREQDFIANTATTIVQVGLASILPAGADQIALTLTRADLGNNSVSASFAFLDDGLVVGGGTFAPTVDIFNGENYTRVEFIASAPVPEPGTYMMLLAGLGLVAWQLRRRARSAGCAMF